MSSITNKQTYLVLLVVVFTTFLITSTVLSSASDNTVFAKSKHKKSVHKHTSSQKISQENKQKQKAVCLTAGANSGVTGSCNNTATASNSNNGGNAAAGSG